MGPQIENGLLAGIEATYAAVPCRRPPATALASARIISHRGERAGAVRENTAAAFDPLLGSGVWGLECDFRFSRDGEPVICHDPDLKRVFGVALGIADTRFAELRRACPDLLHLDDIVARYGAQLHLMLELKTPPRSTAQCQRLARALSTLTPAEDFHVLSLELARFEHLPDWPPQCLLPVARLQPEAAGSYALVQHCGGIAGPHFALTRRRVTNHRAAGQNVGVGFPAHRNMLFREIRRGVNWIFTNHALRLQHMLDAARTQAQLALEAN